MNLAVTRAASWRPPRNKAFHAAALRGMAAVKELSWCAPADSPNRRSRAAAAASNDGNFQNNQLMVPIDSFGIVAAMAKTSRVIGVNGKLPWNLPEDRAQFKRLTANKILVIGRRTLEEEHNLCHISHAAHSIVVSRTLSTSFNYAINRTDNDSKLRIHIVRSFPEALDLARTLEESSLSSSSDNSSSPSPPPLNDINCWVAGGERLYEEALLHPSAKVLHLTIVDMDIDIATTTTTTTTSSSQTTARNTEYARFPAKYRWDHIFRERSRTSNHEQTSAKGDSGGLKYEHYIFERFVR